MLPFYLNYNYLQSEDEAILNVFDKGKVAIILNNSKSICSLEVACKKKLLKDIFCVFK